MKIKLCFIPTPGKRLRRAVHFDNLQQLWAYSGTPAMEDKADIYLANARGHVILKIGVIARGGKITHTKQWEDMAAVVKMFS